MDTNDTETSQRNAHDGAEIDGLVLTVGQSVGAVSEQEATDDPPKGGSQTTSPTTSPTPDALEALDGLLLSICASLRCRSQDRDDLMQVGRVEFLRLNGRVSDFDMRSKLWRKMLIEQRKLSGDGSVVGAGRPRGPGQSGSEIPQTDEAAYRMLLLHPGSICGAMLDRMMELADLRCPYCGSRGWWTDGIDPASVRPGHVVPENGYDRTKAETTQAWVCDRCRLATWEPRPVISQHKQQAPTTHRRSADDRRYLAFVEAGYRLHGKPRR